MCVQDWRLLLAYRKYIYVSTFKIKFKELIYNQSTSTITSSDKSNLVYPLNNKKIELHIQAHPPNKRTIQYSGLREPNLQPVTFNIQLKHFNTVWHHQWCLNRILFILSKINRLIDILFSYAYTLKALLVLHSSWIGWIKEIRQLRIHSHCMDSLEQAIHSFIRTWPAHINT